MTRRLVLGVTRRGSLSDYKVLHVVAHSCSFHLRSLHGRRVACFGCIIKGLTKDLAKKHLSIERR